MKIVLPVVGIAALAYAASGAYLTPPIESLKPSALVPQFSRVGETATLVRPGEPPWKTHERLAELSRKHSRDMLLRALGQPSADFCTDDGRRQLSYALGRYYEIRATQRAHYKTNWGEAGAAFIAQAWSTSDDNRLERLTRETYRNGYFDPAKLNRNARETIAELLRGEKPAGNPCKA